jgi:acyl carrier protein
MSDIESTVREVLEVQGRLPVSVESLKSDEDLYASGLTSHATVNVMLALEDSFDIEFPDELLVKSTFESIAAIRDALISLGATTSTD